MMNNVFCIGELLIDFIGKDINKGIKDGVMFEKKAGGAPANVAAAISRLNGNSYFLGQVGRDSFGDFLIETLEKENINTDMVESSGNTTLSFVAIDENGERNFEFLRGSDGEYSFDNINLDNIKNQDIIHFGSATGFLEGKLRDTYYKLLDYAKQNNIYISFDPNYRSNLISQDNLNDFIERCLFFISNADFVKLSDEEVTLITGEKDLDSGVEKIHQKGAKVVAVTLGAKGTLISNGNNKEIIPSIKIKQIDSTGAGDSFVGGVLLKVSQIDNKREIGFDEWKDIIAYANKIGAITCTNYGAISSMPTLSDLENL